MLFKNPVRTSKRTPHFTITEINWLTLFKFKEFLFSSRHVCECGGRGCALEKDWDMLATVSVQSNTWDYVPVVTVLPQLKT
jgi:hypothetical protein